MTMLDHTQASKQGRQSPHSGESSLSIGPMKEGLRGRRYASDKEVKTAVMKWLEEQSKDQ